MAAALVHSFEAVDREIMTKCRLEGTKGGATGLVLLRIGEGREMGCGRWGLGGAGVLPIGFGLVLGWAGLGFDIYGTSINIIYKNTTLSWAACRERWMSP